MRHLTKLLRRIVILIIAAPLLIGGTILIPLPGPGLLLCFLGLLVLSLEFESSKRWVDKIKQEFKKIYDRARERQERIERLGDKKDTPK